MKDTNVSDKIELHLIKQNIINFGSTSDADVKCQVDETDIDDLNTNLEKL